jgi:hypothetical protein
MLWSWKVRRKCVEIPFSGINRRIVLEKLEVGTREKV